MNLQYEMPLLPEPEPKLPNNPFESASERERRVQQAAAIAACPEHFMFCEGCLNLFKRGGCVEATGVCPICKGYRFNMDPQAVMEQAIRSGTNPRCSVLPGDYD